MNKAKRKPKAPEWTEVESVTLRALPYRPTKRLRRTAEPSYGQRGWRTAQFQGDDGTLYERERDGEYERWWQITEQRGARKKLLYKFIPPKKDLDFGDTLDRHDDFQFLVWALRGLVDEADEQKTFGSIALTDIRSELRNLGDAVDHLGAKMEALRPVVH